MLSSRLFWKIYSVSIAVTLFSSISVIWILVNPHSDQILQSIDVRLNDSAHILQQEMRPVFEGKVSDDLQERLLKLEELNGIRITLIAADGTVLGDSAEDPKQMENHSDRFEIRQAIETGTGKSNRFSNTLNLEMRYSALRVGSSEKLLGVVRTAMPVHAIDLEIANFTQVLWQTALSCAVISLIFSYMVVARLLHPLKEITDAAQAMTKGDLHQVVNINSNDEFGALASSFNIMSTEAASRFAQLQKTSRELAENSEQLATVLGCMSEGVIAIDSTNKILFANYAAEKLLHSSRDSFKGHTYQEVIPAPQIHELIAYVLKMNTQKLTEFSQPLDESCIAAFGTPLPGDVGVGVLLVLHDVTELRQLENLRREFVSNVSHELKTPLTAIQAYAETLLEGGLEDQENNSRFVTSILEHANRLHFLILDMLQLSRIESGQDVFEIVPISLRHIIEDCINALMPKAESKAISLQLLESPEEPYIMGDQSGFRMIFDNLLDNAIKYTPEEGNVTVKWEYLNAQTLSIQVADTGIGIPPEHQERIFERFYRVDKARSRDMGGTGLGLSIVKHLAQVFGGSIKISSSSEVGTIFTLQFELAPAQSVTKHVQNLVP